MKIEIKKCVRYFLNDILFWTSIYLPVKKEKKRLFKKSSCIIVMNDVIH